jgi:hypothetical protein
MTKTPKQQAIARWGQLKTERSSWLEHWQEISSFLLPRSGRFFIQDRDRGQRRNQNIYDSTGTRALEILAAGMMAGMTSPARPWFRLATHDPEMNKYGPVKSWLADATKVMQDVFSKSNTYRALHMVYRELGAFGTAASVMSDDFENVIHHTPLTVGEFALATDWQGNACTMYREFQKTVGETVKEFGRDNCSTTVRNLYDRGALDAWITLVHAVEPRGDRDPTKKDATNMAWRSIYFEIGSTEDQLLRESGYKDFPVLAPRWDVIGGDIYGNSPGMNALGDIKQLQHEQMRKSQGIDYMTKPPLQVPTSMKNVDVNTLPGGITFVDSASQQSGIRPAFQVQLDLSHLMADIQDVRSRINSNFFADMFLMLSQEAQTGRMTATEVAERHEEKMLMLGPVVERLDNELLDPLIDATFARILASGILPPPPQELHGQNLNVEYISMLAQAQQAIGVNGIDRFVGNIGQIATFKPDVLDKFDSDKWAEIYADDLGIDPNLIVASDKVALVRDARAKQQAKQAQIEQAQAASQTAKNLGQTPTTGGNAASDVMGMFSGMGSA